MTALRCLLLLVVLLVAAAAVGLTGCKIMGRDPHAKVMLAAGAMALAAAVLAAAPAVFQQRRLHTAGMFQAAFIGTVAHLGMLLIGGIVLLLLKQVTTPFILWLLAGYWMTLIGLCVIFAKLIHAAPRPAKTGT